MTFVPMTESDDVFRHESFDEQTKTAVCDAYNRAWLSLLSYGDTLANLNRYPDAQRLLIRRIVNAARMGMRDETQLQNEGLRYLKETLMPDWPRES